MRQLLCTSRLLGMPSRITWQQTSIRMVKNTRTALAIKLAIPLCNISNNNSRLDIRLCSSSSSRIQRLLSKAAATLSSPCSVRCLASDVSCHRSLCQHANLPSIRAAAAVLSACSARLRQVHQVLAECAVWQAMYYFTCTDDDSPVMTRNDTDLTLLSFFWL